MSHFDAVIERTLEHEGGFVNNRHDPGGATNRGISLRFLQSRGDLHRDLLELLDDNDDGIIDVADVRDIDHNEAVTIYRNYFWLPSLDRLSAVSVAGKLFDMGVNMGPRQAGKISQRAARAHGRTLLDDGIIGPGSVEVFNSIGAEFIYTLREAYAGFHRALTLRNNALIRVGEDVPDFDTFLPGWLNRDYS